MPSHADVTFGRIVLKNRLATVDRLWEALAEVASAYRSGRELRLADVLVRRGTIGKTEAERVKPLGLRLEVCEATDAAEPVPA